MFVSDEADDIDSRYNLEHYDDEEEEQDGSSFAMGNLASFPSVRDDPNLKGELEDLDKEEIEDLEISPDDNLIAVGKVRDGFYNLEVYVYNAQQGVLFCHHDVLLGNFPLCMEWVGYDPGEHSQGNFLAMGSMTPHIELWDLDVVNTLEPTFVLEGKEKKKSKKKSAKKVSLPLGHRKAVLDLSWNQVQCRALASASADFTVGLWDLEQRSMVSRIRSHTEKVQTVEWHPFEDGTLLSGSFDKSVKVSDCRDPEGSSKSWTLEGEVERAVWDTHDPYYFFASCDTGHVYCVDVRTQNPVFTLHAHSQAATGLCVSSHIPGCLITSSADKTLKIWDVKNHKPSLVQEKDLHVEQIHCMSGCPDISLVFAIGGEREMKVVNLGKNPSVAEHFGLGASTSNASAAGEELSEQESDLEEELALKALVGKTKQTKKSKKQKKRKAQREKSKN